MKKDKEWAKCIVRKELKAWQNVEGGIDEDGIKYILDIIDQLDEQVKPVVPEYMADFIKHRKGTDAYSFGYVMRVLVERDEAKAIKREYDWIDANTELFAQAWLAYPDIEIEEEPLYYVRILEEDEGSYIVKDLNTGKFEMGSKDIHPDVVAEYQTAFTKDEIELMDNGQVLFHTYAEEVDNDN